MQKRHFAFTKIVASPVLAVALFADPSATGQTIASRPKPESTSEAQAALAITWTATSANGTPLNRFWLQGGSAEFNAVLPRTHGLGIGMNVNGLHTSNAGNKVPVNLIHYTVGPAYRHQATSGAHPLILFGNALAGICVGFHGVYPSAGGPVASANSLALNFGGGADMGLTPHVAIRLVEASWLRSQLPNAGNSVQNDLTLSAGIVFHSR